MLDHTFEEDHEEERKAAPAEKEAEDEKAKDLSLRAGLSKKDRAPSPPKRFSPEEIEAYLKSQKAKKRPG